jgi:hypothetical protein
MPAKTIADAHREAVCSLVSARWGKALAQAVSAPTDAHEAAETASTQRIADLSALEAVPGDTADHRDAFFQAVRDNLVSERTRLEDIVNNPELAALLYPVVSDPDPVTTLAMTNQRISTLDSVWTPGGDL